MKIDNDKWFFVSGVLIDMQIQSDRLDAAMNGLMISPESPIRDPQARTEGLLIAALSFLIGDNFDNISWFIYECNYGCDAKEAGCKDDMRLINSHDRLRWLMELDCEI
jgi:hypothetical protein